MLEKNLVLFGETHGYLDEDHIRERALKKLKPDYILYELLENKMLRTQQEKSTFLDQPDEKQFSIISTYGELKTLVGLGLELSIPIIGCDLKNTGRKSTEFKEDEQELMKKRQKHQYNIIKDYASKGTVFVSIGIYHLFPQSKLIQNLKKSEQRFTLLLPFDKEGNVFGTKSESKEVNYESTNGEYELEN